MRQSRNKVGVRIETGGKRSSPVGYLELQLPYAFVVDVCALLRFLKHPTTNEVRS